MLFRTRSNVLFKWDCHKKKQNTPGGCLSLTGRVLFFRIANRRKLEDDCLCRLCRSKDQCFFPPRLHRTDDAAEREVDDEIDDTGRAEQHHNV